MLISIMIIYGLVIGSFLNVVIYRLPIKISLLYPRSTCPSCRHRLAFYDLIPLFSYISTGGKCRYCHTSICIRYPIVESINAILYFLIFQHYGISLYSFIIMTFSSIVLTIAFIDWDFKKIPNTLNGIIFVMAIILVVLGYHNFKETILGLFVALCFAMVVFVLSKLSRSSVMGGGDLKYIIASSAFLGLSSAIIALLFTFLLAGLAIVLLLAIKKISFKSQIPFGPFLAVGSFLSILYSTPVLSYVLL